MSVTGLKKNYDYTDENGVPALNDGIAEIYEEMATGIGSGVGLDILIARGLADWFLSVSAEPSINKRSRSRILPWKGTREASEEMVILFANMLQGGSR